MCLRTEEYSLKLFAVLLTNTVSLFHRLHTRRTIEIKGKEDFVKY